jgi:kinesin family protein 1
MGDSVRVAVRVRPFNGREKDRGAKLIIDMIDKMVRVPPWIFFPILGGF